jgi:hypothetical protein
MYNVNTIQPSTSASGSLQRMSASGPGKLSGQKGRFPKLPFMGTSTSRLIRRKESIEGQSK